METLSQNTSNHETARPVTRRRVCRLLVDLDFPEIPLSEMPKTGVADGIAAMSIGLLASTMAMGSTLGLLVKHGTKTRGRKSAKR